MIQQIISGHADAIFAMSCYEALEEVEFSKYEYKSIRATCSARITSST